MVDGFLRACYTESQECKEGKVSLWKVRQW